MPKSITFPSSFVAAAILIGAAIGMLVSYGPFMDRLLSHSVLQRSMVVGVPWSFVQLYGGSILLGIVILAGGGTLLLVLRYQLDWLAQHKEKIFVFLILTTPHFNAITRSRFDISDLALMVILVFWLATILINNELTFIWSPLYFPLLLLFICIVLSLTNGGITSFLLLPGLLKSLFLFIFLVNTIRDRDMAWFTIKIFLLGAMFSAIVAIFQEVAFIIFREPIAVFVPDHSVKFMYEFNSLGAFLRVPAFTGWYLKLTNFLIVGIILAAILQWYLPSLTDSTKRWLRIGLGLMIIAIIFTFSNAAFLAIFIGLGAVLAIRWPLRMFIVGLLTVSVVSLALLWVDPVSFGHDIKSHLYSQDLRIRIQLFRDGVSGFLHQHPWIGVGFGQANKYTSNYYGWPVHNNLMLVADEFGLLGFCAYALFILSAIGRQIVAVFKVKSQVDRIILYALLMGLLTWTINIQLQVIHIEYFFFMYYGMLEAIRLVILGSPLNGDTGPALNLVPESTPTLVK